MGCSFVLFIWKKYEHENCPQEDQNLMTTSSARHKRGCNCKKSKCLEKYCERYQAKVGCFGGCRCEDCQNTFGTMAESVYNGAKRWEPHPTAKLAASINQTLRHLKYFLI